MENKTNRRLKLFLKKKNLLLLLVLILAFVGLIFGYPRVSEYIFKQQELRSFNTKGGAEIVLQVDMSGVPVQERSKVFEESKDIIFRRVRLFGFYPFIKTSQNQSDYKMTIQIAHVGNLDELAELIGTTAKLEFREFTDSNTPLGTIPTLENTKPTGISGKDLKSAASSVSQGGSVVNFTLRDYSVDKFKQVTRSLIGKPLIVFLDGNPVSAPVIQSEIGQQGVITGLSSDESKTLAIQLSAGAFPTSIKVLGKKYVKR